MRASRRPTTDEGHVDTVAEYGRLLANPPVQGYVALVRFYGCVLRPNVLCVLGRDKDLGVRWRVCTWIICGPLEE